MLQQNRKPVIVKEQNTAATSCYQPNDLLHTDALPTEVQLESFVALAPVAPRSWDAASILTEVTIQLAVISDVDWQHH